MIAGPIIRYQTVEEQMVKRKETIDLFTQGTKDAETLLPVLSFIEPYVKENRQSKVEKYLDNKDDVME